MTAVRERQLDLDAEQEVDLGRYGRSLAQRFWLPLAGLIVGAIIGYLLSLSAATVFRAQALVYEGAPIGIGGNALQGLNTNPAAIRAIVKSESVIRQVAKDVGLKPGQLRANVSATPPQGSSAKTTQAASLVLITVKGTKPARVRAAANKLGQVVVAQLSAYARTKIRTLSAQLASDNASIQALNDAIGKSNLSLAHRLLVQLNLSRLQDDAAQVTQQLSIARNVESPRIVTRAVAEKTSARSHRNSTVVGALIGLILGGIAALLWDPLLERRARR